MIKTKKGAAAHMEIILSFVIFLVFVVFVLVFFNPLKKYPALTTNLDTTESIILDVVSINLTTVSLNLNMSAAIPAAATPGDCFSLVLPLPNKIIAKDENLNAVNARNNDPLIDFEFSGQKFYKIYSSNELVEDIPVGACSLLPASDYSLGVQKIEKKISYSKLAKFNDDYTNDYEQLKMDLNLTNEFNVAVKIGSEYLFKAEKYKPKSIEIMAKDVPIEILDENASIIYGIMNIQVWE